jgi:hypothetical protein
MIDYEKLIQLYKFKFEEEILKEKKRMGTKDSDYYEGLMFAYSVLNNQDIEY